MIAYADTGFLISLYGEDENSARATALIASRPIFVLTPLGETEFLNAVELRVFRKGWNRRTAREVREKFLLDQASGSLFRPEPLSPEVWETAQAISSHHTAKLGVRTLDLLHVASALVLKPDVFFSFDERQRKLARAEGLSVLPA